MKVNAIDKLIDESDDCVGYRLYIGDKMFDVPYEMATHYKILEYRNTILVKDFAGELISKVEYEGKFRVPSLDGNFDFLDQLIERKAYAQDPLRCHKLGIPKPKWGGNKG